MANNNQTANVTVTLDGKQAEKMLEILRLKSESLRDELRTLNNQRLSTGLTGDEAKRFDALRKELLETRRVSREVARQVKDVDDVIKNLSTAPIKAIKDSIKTLENQMSRLDRSTEKYAENQKKLKLLREELNRINGTAAKTTTAFDQIGQTMKRLASYVLIYSGFNQLTAGIRKMYDNNVALSDQLADIQKTTGLTGQSLKELSDDILKLNTRTSVEELNKLAVAAGKLGISAKEDVLEFVKAGDIINVALGEDLGEDAIRSIAKLNDVLNITNTLGVEKGLLATGSAINELGQNSTANEGYLVDFAQRLGGIAAQSKLTIQQVLALGSVSDQLGQSSEVAATALNKLITTLLSKTGQVAKAIGVPLEELQAALQQDTWTGLMMVFDKLASKGGLAAIAPLMGDLGSDGARLNAVISALTADTSRLTREMDLANKAFADGTSVLNEFNAKNNNLAANIQKIGKNIERWFMGTTFIAALNSIAVKVEAITRGVDDTEDAFKKSVSTVSNLQKNIVPLLSEYDKLKDSTAADEQKRLKEIMTQIAAVIPSAVTEMDKYGNVLSISTERAYSFVEAQKMIMQQNNKELIKETEKTIKELEGKFESARLKVEEIQKKGGYTQLDLIYNPGLGSSMTQTQSFITDPEKIKAAQQAYVSLNAELERQRGILSELSGDFLTKEIEKLKKTQDATMDDAGNVLTGGEPIEDIVKRQIAAIDLWLQKKKNALMEARQAEQDINSESYISEEEYNKAVQALEIKALEEKLRITGMEEKDIAEARGRIYEIRQQMADDAAKIQAEIKKILLEADPVAKENAAYEKRLRSLNLFGVDRKYLTEEQLKALEQLELQHVQNLEDIDRKNREREKRRAEERYKQEVESTTGMTYDMYSNTRSLGLDTLQQELDFDVSVGAGESEIFARQMAIHTMRMQLLQEELEMRKKVGADTGEVYKKMNELEGNMVQESATRFKTLASTYQQYGSQIGDAFGNLIGGQEDALLSLADATIDILFQVLDQMANAWIAELAGVAVKNVAKSQMESLATPDSVLTFGASGLARAAIMAGLITAALSAAKAGIKAAIRGGDTDTSISSSGSTGSRVVLGYSTGGHTGDGPAMEVAGVVHRGEYVVPKWQMSDPISFDYVRALENIRRTRTSAHPLPGAGFAEGGYTTPPSSPNYPVASESMQINRTMERMNRLLEKLDRQGVHTNLNISNLNTAQAKYEASKARGTLRG